MSLDRCASVISRGRGARAAASGVPARRDATCIRPNPVRVYCFTDSRSKSETFLPYLSRPWPSAPTMCARRARPEAATDAHTGRAARRSELTREDASVRVRCVPHSGAHRPGAPWRAR